MRKRRERSEKVIKMERDIKGKVREWQEAESTENSTLKVATAFGCFSNRGNYSSSVTPLPILQLPSAKTLVDNYDCVFLLQ